MNGKIVAGILILLIFVLFIWRPQSGYRNPSEFSSAGANNWGAGIFNERGAETDVSTGGWGVSTSMLPREIPSQEDFGSFSPDDIMKGQTYLDPRAQIGYPETTGGVLRNSSLDLRSEPPNPRTPVSIFNNSTIVPDTMRPRFEIDR